MRSLIDRCKGTFVWVAAIPLAMLMYAGLILNATLISRDDPYIGGAGGEGAGQVAGA